MPSSKTPLAIPKLTPTHIQHANDCAELLLNGISFETGKEIESDFYFLHTFSSTAHHYVNGTHQQITWSQPIYHSLIITPKLKAMLRLKHQLDFQQFEKLIEINIHQFIKDLSDTKKPVELTLAKFTYDCGRELVSRQVRTKAGFRIPLASRILFYAIPQASFFNFSNALASELQLQSRPQTSIFNFYKIMRAGYDLNLPNLPDFSTLQSKGGSYQKIHSLIKNTDWWQRRVFDIALLLHLNITKSLNPLPQIP